MYEDLEDQVDFCNGFSPLEEESMPESTPHAELIWYLVAVLKWLFHGSVCTIFENFAFFLPSKHSGPPVAPDIAIIKGVASRPLSSWRVDKTGPAPQVVLEILSAETWKKDLQEKPDLYARMGVQEYFAYDPHPFPLARATAQRLFGWRRDPLSGRMTALWPNPDGSLWSRELDSSLVPHREVLRLYDRNGQLRLTEAEARAQQAEAEAEAKWAEAAARQEEAAAREAAERRAEVLAEKLRSLGVDPDQL